jgi:hypothetical protein
MAGTVGSHAERVRWQDGSGVSSRSRACLLDLARRRLSFTAGGNYAGRMEKRTRSGKIVGSLRTDPSGWMCWQEGEKWMLVAPSGARINEYDTEAEARREVDGRNAKWFAPAR